VKALRQIYLDAVDLREIDQLAIELRRSNDTDETFQARRLKILDLYMAGIQSREAILTELRGYDPLASGTSPL
jgi:hypothetical protein